MNLLVAGGAGFIGANFIFYQRRRYPSDTLVCLDALTYAANPATLDVLKNDPGFLFCREDICSTAQVAELLTRQRIDAVVNFAAETHVDRSVSDPMTFFKSNTLGTVSLLEACRQAGVSRLHQVSTDEVYGDLPLQGDEAFTENSLLRPSSPYAASKASADLTALAYCRTYDMHITISRCGNNYGPYQFPEKLIPRMISLALEDKPLPVYGTGQNIRDWIYVSDHCSAIDCILRRGRAGQIYNVGARCPQSNLAILRQLLSAIGRPQAQIEFIKDRPGHDQRYTVDPSALEHDLGWRAVVPLSQGLNQTAGWYLEHTDWWRPLLERSLV